MLLQILFVVFQGSSILADTIGSNQRLPFSGFGIPGVDTAYDYVVVGGGAAGLAVASRLAETHTVAVVEAGGIYQVDNGNRSVIPLLALTGISFIDTTEAYPRQPLMDWDLVTAPVAGAAQRKIHYAQGKTLGGSTAINTMSYNRGSTGYYQRWADLVDDQSFTFSRLLPFFKKSANLSPPNQSKRNSSNTTVTYDPAVFSVSGAVKVSWNNWVDPTLTWLAKTVQSIGLPLSPNGFSSGTLAGFGSWVPSTINPTNAQRESAATAYLEKYFTKTDIMVYTQTQALKVLFNDSVSKKASGVRVSTRGLEYTLSARNEVIVSAGTFHSPQLLMVSGIGPQSTLQSLNIPVISNLAGVGQNLIDHIGFGILYFINTPSGASIVSTPEGHAKALKEYLQNAAGPYSSAAGYFSFEKLPNNTRNALSRSTRAALDTFPSDWPEIEYIGGSFPFGSQNVGAINAVNLVPLSRGNITISSNSMTDKPIINLGWLSEAADTEVVVAAFKRLRQAWATSAANEIIVGAEFLPGPTVTSDADILNYIRQSANPMWHASSTCKMGRVTDPMAVVGVTGKVFGVSGLRVVDNSIVPVSVPGHPQANLYMLAEKIADDIKNGR